MAEKIVLEIEIKTGNSTASVKSVKAELRQLKAEMAGLEIGSAEFTKLAQRAGQLEDAIGDANAAVKAFNPEAKFQGIANVMGAVANGFSAAQGAIAMFGGESEELNKIMVQTQGAIALATGINGLMGMKDALGVLAIKIQTQVVAAFSSMKSALIATGIGAFVVALGIAINEIIKYNEAIDEEANAQERLNEELKKSKDLMEGVAAASEKQRNAKKGGLDDLKRELDLLEASGASEKKLFEKREQLLKTELQNLKVRKYSGLDVTKEIADKENEILANQLAYEKSVRDKREEEQKKAAEKKKKQEENNAAFARDATKRLEHFQQEAWQKEIDSLTNFAKSRVSITEQEANDLLKVRKLTNEELAKLALMNYEQQLEYVKKLAEDEKEIERIKTETKLMELSSVASALNSFGQIAGQQTAAGKALSVAQTTIDTYVAAFRAYKEGFKIDPTGTLSIINATAATVAGIAAVKRIIAVQVPGGGGGSVPSAPNMSVPRMTATGNQVSGAGAISLNSQPQTKVYVVESDIRRVQNRVEVIENNARIG